MVSIKKLSVNNKAVYFVLFLLVINWLSWLSVSAPEDNSFFAVYALAAFAGIFSFILSIKAGIFSKFFSSWPLTVSAALFSIAVILANYSSLLVDSHSVVSAIKTLVSLVLFFTAGFFLALSFLGFITFRLNDFCWQCNAQDASPQKVFLCCFLIIIAVYALVYMLFFPGVTTVDSTRQIQQTITGVYNNHHPFYHTLIIGLFMDCGELLFKSSNAGIALYCIFQMLFMAAAFSALITTIYQAGASRKFCLAVLAWYCLLPANIMYSFTLWKDVIFAGMMLLMLLALFRYFAGIGAQGLNFALFCTAGIGVCLFRSNGLFAFIISFLVFLVLFRKKYKSLSLAFALIIAAALILKGPFLEKLNVTKTDPVESLSIPIQQISRVISEGHEASPEQQEFLSNLLDYDKIADTYDPHISDPIKYLIWDKDNVNHFNSNKAEYFKLWLDLGIKHPALYLFAWADQTKGYWNGGYDYWILSNGSLDESSRIQGILSPLRAIWWSYTDLFQDNVYFSFLNIFVSLGLYTWIISSLFIRNIVLMKEREREYAFLPVPLLSIILSLMIATPVYSEFRYAYALVTCIPLIIYSAFFKSRKNNI